MNYQLVINYINKRYGKDVKISPMYEKINQWREWIDGNVHGFHTFHKKIDLNDDSKAVPLHRHRTNMLLKGAEDWASILMNEKTRIIIGDENSSKFVMGDDEISGVFGENDFWRCANELVATSRWSGTGAFEVYIKRMVVDDENNHLIKGSGIGINYLAADQIIPISYDNGILREAAFISERQSDGKKVYLISVHLLNEDNTYNIESFFLDEYGNYIPEEGYGRMVYTGCPVPLFSLIRKSGINIFDYDSPFGVSIISGAEDILRGLDCAFDNFITDFKLGRKMVLMSKSMFTTDEQGNTIAPQESEEQLFINAGDKILDGGLYQEYNPSLRVMENANGLQKMLDLFSLRIGLGAKRYVLDGGGQIAATTATQWVGERQDMVQNAYKEMICIEKALKEVVRAVLWVGKNVFNEKIDPEATITIVADDSYIIDSDTEKMQWIQDLNLGIRSKTEYRMHFYGESPKEAAKNVQPTLAELIQGAQAGVVSKAELRKYLFPYESDKQAQEAVEKISAENNQLDDAAFERTMAQQAAQTEQQQTAAIEQQRKQAEYQRGIMNDSEWNTGDDSIPENPDVDINDVPFK